MSAEHSVDSVDTLIDALRSHIEAIARHQSYVNNLSVLLEPDDIISELTMEVILCWKYYGPRNLGSEAMVKLGMRMVHNRMSELIHKHHGTHRKASIWNTSVDDDDSIEDVGLTPEGWVEFTCRLDAFLDSLTDDELVVVRAILIDDARVRMWLKLYALRRAAAFDNPTVQVTHELIADALHLPREHTKALFASIRRKWRSTYDR